MEPLRRGGPEGWLALAVAAAATAGGLALVVTAARLPPLAGTLPPEAFYKALVGHVTFSLVVWLLSCSVAVALQHSAASAPGYGPFLGAVGAGVMLAGLVLPGRPVVIDYLPYVSSPPYIGGYLLFAAAAAVGLWPCATSGPCWGPRSLAVAYAASLAAVAAGLARLGGISAQAALWSGGHALQFVYVVGLALAWYALAGVPSQLSPLSRTAFGLAGALSWVPTLLVLASGPVDLPRWTPVNLAMGLSLSVPTLLHLVVLAPQVVRSRPELEGTALRWSVGLYLLGGLLAPVGGANTLRVTAHYHAMLVGGVTTAFMGVAYRILEEAGLPVRKDAGRLQVHLFGLGVLMTVAALLVAAAHGLPRKAYLSAAHPWSLPLLLLAGAAAFAAAGGGWFVASTWLALRRARRAPDAHPFPVLAGGR